MKNPPNMKYETALALKEAGFPQPALGSMGAWQGPKDWKQEDLCYCPKLSELIEECGTQFWGLRRRTQHSWIADSWNAKEADIHGYGTTPEEAVAHLYLSLHGKKD